MASAPNQQRSAGGAAEGWTEPLPLKVPSPTCWPAALALGIAIFLMGFVTSYAFSVAGAGLMAISIGKWVGQMLEDTHGD